MKDFSILFPAKHARALKNAFFENREVANSIEHNVASAITLATIRNETSTVVSLPTDIGFDFPSQGFVSFADLMKMNLEELGYKVEQKTFKKVTPLNGVLLEISW